MVLWETWLTTLAGSLGLSVTNAGIFISLLFIGVFTIVGLLASRSGNGGVLMLVVSSMVFTFMGWLHYWVTLLMVLLVVGMYASRLSRWFGGG